MVRFIAETGILSRPDGDDAKACPGEADAGMLVARDKLGRPPSVVSPLVAEAGEPAGGGFVGEEEMCK